MFEDHVHARVGQRLGLLEGVPNLVVTVVPDSGTDEFTGLAGAMTIIINEGKHSYVFSYTLDSALTKR
jgi:hypothetical protein